MAQDDMAQDDIAQDDTFLSFDGLRMTFPSTGSG